jgi:hypothetical protein
MIDVAEHPPPPSHRRRLASHVGAVHPSTSTATVTSRVIQEHSADRPSWSPWQWWVRGPVRRGAGAHQLRACAGWVAGPLGFGTCWRRCCWPPPRSPRSPPTIATYLPQGPIRWRRQPRSPGGQRSTASDSELIQRPRKDATMRIGLVGNFVNDQDYAKDAQHLYVGARLRPGPGPLGPRRRRPAPATGAQRPGQAAGRVNLRQGAMTLDSVLHQRLRPLAGAGQRILHPRGDAVPDRLPASHQR